MKNQWQSSSNHTSEKQQLGETYFRWAQMQCRCCNFYTTRWLHVWYEY